MNKLCDCGKPKSSVSVHCQKCYLKSRIGKKLSVEQRHKMSESKLNEKNPAWKGIKVGYGAIHKWVRRKLPQPILCMDCNKKKSKDLANISGEYKRDLSDWEYLCRRCHMLKDGRMTNLKQYKTL